MLIEQHATATPDSAPPPPAQIGTGGLTLVLVLFVCFRLMAVVLLLPGGYLFRGQQDHGFYANFAEFSALGYFPYISYWLEYPPLFGWTLVGLYQLSTLLPRVGDAFFWFHTAVGVFLLLAETGSLILIHRLARLMYDERTALRCAWIYAGLFTPLYVMLGTFEGYPLFFLLLALYLVLGQRPGLGGLATGVGFQIKLLPMLAVPVAWHALAGGRRRLIYLLAAGLTVVAVALPFWLINPAILTASVQAMLTRSSWETAWALLEGYYSFGKVAPLADRFVPESATWQAHQSTLPWLLIEAGFLGLYALVWTRRFDYRLPSRVVALAGLTVNLFLLASKGYSSQYLVYLLPFIVLLLPNTAGAAYAILLGVLDIVEGVFYFMFFPEQHWLLVVTVLGRALLWILLCLEYLAVLIPGLRATRERVARSGLVPGVAFVAALSLAALAAATLLPRSPSDRYAAAADLIRREGAASPLIVLASRDSFLAARPYLPAGRFWFPTARTDGSPDQAEADLAGFVRGQSAVWLIADREAGAPLVAASLRYWLDWHGSLQAVRWLDGLELRSYRLPATGDPVARVGHRFEAGFGALDLIGYDLAPAEAVVGEPFRLFLYWRASAPAGADYQTFVHLINPAYRSFGTGDRALQDELGRPPTRWAAGQVVRQAYTLQAAPGTPPGDYMLEVGLYDADGGKRLPVVVPGSTAPSDRVLIPGIVLRRGLPLLAAAMQRPSEAVLGGLIALAGCDCAERASPGEQLEVTLYWRPLRQVANDYTVFVHLVDASGRVRAQHDGSPVDAQYPTTRWESGELVRDSHIVLLPRDLPPGEYILRAGLYLPGTGGRLAVRDAEGHELADAVDLGRILVAAR